MPTPPMLPQPITRRFRLFLTIGLCAGSFGLAVACGGGGDSSDGNGDGSGGDGSGGDGSDGGNSSAGGAGTGSGGGGLACQPKTVAEVKEQQGFECGTWGDGCDGDLDLGECTAPAFCAPDRTCMTPGEECEGKTEAECGDQTCEKDACGFDCGTCGARQLCNLEGKCECNGFDTCAVALESAGKACGMVPDGCGGMKDCGGACNAGSACNSAGACEELPPPGKPSNLVPSDPSRAKMLGNRIAISGNGERLAIQAAHEAVAGKERVGAVYVFRRELSGGWVQEHKFVPHNVVEGWVLGGSFGLGMAFSEAGDTLAIGHYDDPSKEPGVHSTVQPPDPETDPRRNSAQSGAVYVYRRSGSTWNLHSFIKASNAQKGDIFGHSVALTRDGRTLAVGATGEDSLAEGAFPAPTGPEALSSDRCASNNKDNRGAVYLYELEGSEWRETQYFKAMTQGLWCPSFGATLALSDDGRTLAINAVGDAGRSLGITTTGAYGGVSYTDPSSTIGAVYVFHKGAGGWQGEAYIKASYLADTGHFNFGKDAVALSGDGSVLAIGAAADLEKRTGVHPASNAPTIRTLEGHQSGAVFLYRKQSSNWALTDYIKSPDFTRNSHALDADDRFGSSVALSQDGKTLAVGSPGEDGSSSGARAVSGTTTFPTNNDRKDSGAVFVYQNYPNNGGWQYRAYIKQDPSTAEGRLGYQLAMPSSQSFLGVTGWNTISNSGQALVIPFQ